MFMTLAHIPDWGPVGMKESDFQHSSTRIYTIQHFPCTLPSGKSRFGLEGVPFGPSHGRARRVARGEKARDPRGDREAIEGNDLARERVKGRRSGDWPPAVQRNH
jgi:hypothetical protein